MKTTQILENPKNGQAAILKKQLAVLMAGGVLKW